MKKKITQEIIVCDICGSEVDEDDYYSCETCGKDLCSECLLEVTIETDYADTDSDKYGYFCKDCHKKLFEVLEKVWPKERKKKSKKGKK